MSAENTPVFVAIFHSNSKYYLLLSVDDNTCSIQGWVSLPKALSYFEDGYNQCHSRSYESSMSACINFIQFQPKIVSFDGLDDMIKKLDLQDNPTPLRLSSISGSYTVLKLKTELAESLYDNGFGPKLITKESPDEYIPV